MTEAMEHAPSTEVTGQAGERTGGPRRPSPQVIGAVLAGTVFLALLFGGHLSLLQKSRSAGDFYDVQADSFLDLRWDVPEKSLFLEGFKVDGKVYEYFGPLPALLRLPVAAITDDLDGRLGQLSVLFAFAVAMLFTIRVERRIRMLVHGTNPDTRLERWASGAFVFVVGAGSVITFLASRFWVYHEAELWGLALALGAFDFIIAFTIDPTRRRLLFAGLLTAAALMSRGSVGFGPLAALGMLAVACCTARTRRLVGMAVGPSRRLLGLMALAVSLPAALYMYVNFVKFGSLVSLPFEKQLSTQLFPINRRIVEENGFITPRMIPSNLVQYLRPDGLRFDALFPWVTFADPGPHVGKVTYAWTWSSSYPATMPALTVLGIVGAVGVFRRHAGPAQGLRPLRLPVLGALLATIPTFSYAYIAHRYISDLVPLGVLTAAAGLHLALRWGRARPGRPAQVVWAGLAGLALLSLWFNIGLAVRFGRLLDGSVTPRDRASFVAFQYDLQGRLPGSGRPRVATGTALPEPGREKAFVVGDCGALFWADRKEWFELERGEGGGRYRLSARFPDEPTGWQPFVVAENEDGSQVLSVRVLPGGRVQFAFDTVFVGEPLRLRGGPDHDVTLLMDTIAGSPTEGELTLRIDGGVAWSSVLPNDIITGPLLPPTRVTFGRGDVPGLDPRFTGTLHHRPVGTPRCRDVLGGPSD